MPKLSAGLVVFRRSPQVEVLLVHPGGPFWAKKDAGAWSIPKGEYLEDDDALQAALREFKEEIGFPAPEGDKPVFLGEVKYSNKLLRAWAIEGTVDAQDIKSNFFEVEWPPKSGKIQQFPEVDRADWFTLAQARKKLVGGQVPLVEALAVELDIHDKPELQMSLF